ncbi:MAG: Crp/Fnr family transcriptional regulator [Chitinivibrionales bacterium]|nr:Crp/Fnr family transcriptional regulator [Chitinivibrionales bacterium]
MDREKLMQLALKVPLFGVLTARERTALCDAMIMREFLPGQTIVQQEDEGGQTFFIIISGIVHVAVMAAEGKQTILATLRPGDFFGEMAILDGEPRSASVIAADRCTLLMLYRAMFMDILQKYPKIAIAMLSEMSKRIRRANRHINTLSLMSVYGRVATVLLNLAREQGQKNHGLLVIPDRPTHQVLADMVGCSRETVSRVISQLQKKHYIAMDKNRIIILNAEKIYE